MYRHLAELLLYRYLPQVFLYRYLAECLMLLYRLVSPRSCTCLTVGHTMDDMKCLLVRHYLLGVYHTTRSSPVARPGIPWVISGTSVNGHATELSDSDTSTSL